MSGRRRPCERIGDLIPEAARRLGLDDELRRARSMAMFETVVEEHAPAAAGACRAIRIDGEALVVEADAPIVAQELRLTAPRLVAALRASPAGTGIREIRVHVRPPGPRV